MGERGLDVKSLPLDERAQCAAYLRARHNMSQIEIGNALGGLSQPHVSRLLAHAQKQKYLIVTERFAEERFSTEWIQQMDELLAPPALSDAIRLYCDRHGYIQPNIRVFESGSGQTESAMMHRRNRFGRTASGRLAELLAKASTVGVAWGRTIRALVDGVAAPNRLVDPSQNIEFVPVCAEFVKLTQRGYSASRLAEQLDDIYNDGAGETVSMTGFPAFIPRAYDADMQRSIRKLVTDTPSHAHVFSGEDPLVDRMDMLISSVGSSQRPLIGALEELMHAGQVSAEQIGKLIVGDLSGILIPKDDLSESDRDLVDDLNRMWTGMKIDHVRRLAARAARDPQMTGVVIVALQAERGDAILELIRSGLVNELIIDQAAADRLFELLSAPGPMR